MVTLPVPINLLSRRGLIGNECCDTRSLICLLPAALFWYWQPAAVAQSISGSLRRPALQYACTRHNEESTAGVRIEPSPDIELSWRLESNQTLCLARQCPHRCVPDSSRASHLFAVLVGRTSCLKHLACTWRRQDDIVHQTHLILGFA